MVLIIVLISLASLLASNLYPSPAVSFLHSTPITPNPRVAHSVTIRILELLQSPKEQQPFMMEAMVKLASFIHFYLALPGRDNALVGNLFKAISTFLAKEPEPNRIKMVAPPILIPLSSEDKQWMAKIHTINYISNFSHCKPLDAIDNLAILYERADYSMRLNLFFPLLFLLKDDQLQELLIWGMGILGEPCELFHLIGEIPYLRPALLLISIECGGALKLGEGPGGPSSIRVRLNQNYGRSFKMPIPSCSDHEFVANFAFKPSALYDLLDIHCALGLYDPVLIQQMLELMSKVHPGLFSGPLKEHGVVFDFIMYPSEETFSMLTRKAQKLIRSFNILLMRKGDTIYLSVDPVKLLYSSKHQSEAFTSFLIQDFLLMNPGHYFVELEKYRSSSKARYFIETFPNVSLLQAYLSLLLLQPNLHQAQDVAVTMVRDLEKSVNELDAAHIQLFLGMIDQEQFSYFLKTALVGQSDAYLCLEALLNNLRHLM